MAKLIRILAASLGGGLVLGAGIRMGEAIASRDAASGTGNAKELADRLSRLEGRLSKLSDRDLEGAESVNPELGAMTASLRGELREWLDESVGVRMAEVEKRLRAEAERSQKQILDAFIESVQTRVIHRISRLEEEFTNQSTAMTELRECSLRTEESMQKLLGGLDRLIVTSPAGER
jgi:hypothetical protein